MDEQPTPTDGGATCPKCGSPTPNGWCRSCARKRQSWIALLLFLILPALGFGSCLLAIGSGTTPTAGSISMIGGAICVLSPFVGLAYLAGVAIYNHFRND